MRKLEDERRSAEETVCKPEREGRPRLWMCEGVSLMTQPGSVRSAMFMDRWALLDLTSSVGAECVTLLTELGSNYADRFYKHLAPHGAKAGKPFRASFIPSR